MFAKAHRGAIAALAIGWIATAPGRAAPAGSDAPPLYNRGLRWIGVAQTCVAPRGWVAERLFRGTALPGALGRMCLYTWSSASAPPSQAQLAALASASGAQELTEDVPVLYPSGFSAQDTALFTGLRGALRAQVGDASLLPAMPDTPAVRVVVIDSAPDAVADHLQPGLSRHGDTLAHLIEDLVCVPGDAKRPRRCAAEVTTMLALPWIDRGVPGDHGGNLGTLADLSRAIERAVATWKSDRSTAPDATPAHLVLNLSLGWEHTEKIADCSTAELDKLGPPARAVRGILQYAAAQSALIVAAAGNDAGGPKPRTGLICPGRYQAVPQDDAAGRSLVVAVSGLDYRDHPLETVRPAGTTGIAALGLGGVAWSPSDPVPPALTGSSVSTAVVSAVSALTWAAQPSWAAGAVSDAVYHGGVELGTAADDCPLSIGACHSRRASVCGALATAGQAVQCVPAAARPASCPALPSELAALEATYAAIPASLATVLPDPVALASLPRYVAPTVQVEPYVFPMPISETCPTCAVHSAASTSAPALLIPARSQILDTPVLVVRLASGTLHAVSLGDSLAANTPYVFPLPGGWIVLSAYLTGFDTDGDSITEQLFVAP